jgi:hypothetical protein
MPIDIRERELSVSADGPRTGFVLARNVNRNIFGSKPLERRNANAKTTRM